MIDDLLFKKKTSICLTWTDAPRVSSSLFEECRNNTIKNILSIVQHKYIAVNYTYLFFKMYLYDFEVNIVGP